MFDASINGRVHVGLCLRVSVNGCVLVDLCLGAHKTETSQKSLVK